MADESDRGEGQPEEAKAAQAEKQFEKVKSDEEKLQKEIEKVKADNEKFQKEIEKVKPDNEKLQKEIEKVKADNEKFHKEIEKVKPDNEKLDFKEHKVEKFEHKEGKLEKHEVKEHKPEIKEHKPEIKEVALEKPPTQEVATKASEGPLPIEREALRRHAQALEETGRQLRHFIEQSERPDLSTGALGNEPDTGEDG